MQPTVMSTVLVQRLDNFEGRLRSLAKILGPTGRRHIEELCAEFRALRRDLSIAGVSVAPLTTISECYTNPAAVGPGWRPRIARKNPVPGKRLCSKCGALKPFSEFHIDRRRGGKLHSYCKDCQKVYARERYLRVGQKAVDIEVLVGDECVGQSCPECGKPFEPGQHVSADHLVHSLCVRGGGRRHQRCASRGGRVVLKW